jgi:hypothetical protein
MDSESMSEEMQKKDFKVVLIPVTCQPPTFGMVMSIMAMYDKYDEFVICVKDDPILLDTETLVKMLSLIFRLPKFMVISHTQDFESLVEFPQDLPFFNYVATLSERAYTNLALKGYGCYLIPRAMGYDEVFHRSAWRQSNALDILRSNVRQTKFKDCVKKSEPRKEGD